MCSIACVHVRSYTYIHRYVHVAVWKFDLATCKISSNASKPTDMMKLHGPVDS